MALRFAMSDLVRATLPQGQGWVGLVGVEPAGRAYHVLAPVDLDLAWGLMRLGLLDQARELGGHPGWRYRLCPAYAPPPPRRGRPPAIAFRAARQAQALATGRELLAWAARQGWWASLEDMA
ncbi:MAG: hypothetical protein HY910_17795 [Desulfarculus sp.]|nr:hypothetical protein [Desulfarculus sp.]